MSASDADIFDADDADGDGHSVPVEPPAVTARRAAMNWLARREHSFHELLQKLGDKFPDFDRDAVLLPMLRQLQDANLQSDARFAEAFVRYRSTRGCGPLKIAVELYPRKLDSELLQAVLHDNGPDWEALCMDALRKKFRVSAPPSVAERQRWQRFLQQRGFEHQHIRAAFRALHTTPDDEEG